MFIESTLPPGFCEKKIIPNIEKVFEQRGIGKQNVKLAYSFERVMPETITLTPLEICLEFIRETISRLKICAKIFSIN